MFTIRQVDKPIEKSSICGSILYALPDWFGNEETNKNSIQKVKEPDDIMFGAFDDNKAVGFVVLVKHYECTREIALMGVLAEYHRKGIGRSLVAGCEELCRKDGVKFLTVKTLDSSRECGYYARTRRFYESMGFMPLEVLPKHWDEENPCLFLVKYLS